jgi:hypothetical protein
MSVTVNLQARKTDNSLDIDVAALISLYSHRPSVGELVYPTYHGSSVSPSLGTNATWQYYAACFPLAPGLVSSPLGSSPPVPWTLSDLGIMSFGAETV